MKIHRNLPLSIIFVAGILNAQGWSNWTTTATNPELEYRAQPVPNMHNCYLEFRDKNQGSGNTTFDVAIDYGSTTLKDDGEPTVKTDTEHVVITPTHVGTARVTECLGVSKVSASFVQRH
jgi:hypothetical protein